MHRAHLLQAGEAGIEIAPFGRGDRFLVDAALAENLPHFGGFAARFAFQEPQGVAALHRAVLLGVSRENDPPVMPLGELEELAHRPRAELSGLIDPDHIAVELLPRLGFREQGGDGPLSSGEGDMPMQEASATPKPPNQFAAAARQVGARTRRFAAQQIEYHKVQLMWRAGLRRWCYRRLPPFHPMKPIVNFSRKDSWHIKDAFEGTLILGGTGSGKTSGAGATLAKGLLKRGFGGLVLTAKPEELDLWRRRCEETGRSGDLEVFGEGSDHRFNFVTYELQRLADGGVVTESIVDLLITAMESGRRAGGGMSESYWVRGLGHGDGRGLGGPKRRARVPRPATGRIRRMPAGRLTPSTRRSGPAHRRSPLSPGSPPRAIRNQLGRK